MPAPPFPNAANAATTPFANGHFRVKWDGRYVPNLTLVSALERSTEILPSTDPIVPTRFTPGATHFPAILLHRTLSADTAFEDWANKVWNFRASLPTPKPAPPNNLRKDVLLEIHNDAGQKLLGYFLYGCWPSAYTPFSPLDATSNAALVETLTLQTEGWERDTGFRTPTQIPA